MIRIDVLEIGARTPYIFKPFFSPATPVVRAIGLAGFFLEINMSNQKLAVVGKVVEINKIEGADFVQQAKVFCGDAGVWYGVCAKDILAGELVTVFLQDALLPPDSRWAFMEKNGWRVKMCKFLGVPSECLILKPAEHGKVGDDLTSALGVSKYSKPIPAGVGGDIVGEFPSFIPKTDEPNYQAVDWQFFLSLGSWYASEKADGTSCTVWFDDAGMHVASRNYELKEFNASGAKNVYWETAKKYDFTKLPAGIAAQFEVVGGKVQGNPMQIKGGTEGRLFTLYDYKNKKRLPLDEIQRIGKLIKIPTTPIILSSRGSMSLESLRELSNIYYQDTSKSNGSISSGEGVVIRDYAKTWSFKVINLNYKH